MTPWLLPQTAYASQNQPIVHFGLGDSRLIEEIEIFWPSGKVDNLKNVRVNQRLIIEETTG